MLLNLRNLRRGAQKGDKNSHRICRYPEPNQAIALSRVETLRCVICGGRRNDYHRMARRPEPWAVLRRGLKHSWVVPFRSFEWLWEWIAYGLSRWSFLEVLEYLGGFSVLVGVIFYFSESGDHTRRRRRWSKQAVAAARWKGAGRATPPNVSKDLQILQKESIPPRPHRGHTALHIYRCPAMFPG